VFALGFAAATANDLVDATLDDLHQRHGNLDMDSCDDQLQSAPRTAGAANDKSFPDNLRRYGPKGEVCSTPTRKLSSRELFNRDIDDCLKLLRLVETIVGPGGWEIKSRWRLYWATLTTMARCSNARGNACAAQELLQSALQVTEPKPDAGELQHERQQTASVSNVSLRVVTLCHLAIVLLSSRGSANALYASSLAMSMMHGEPNGTTSAPFVVARHCRSVALAAAGERQEAAEELRIVKELLLQPGTGLEVCRECTAMQPEATVTRPAPSLRLNSLVSNHR